VPDFLATFGARYAQETHPAWGFVHPDGYVRITAPDYEVARAWLIEAIGTAWSDLMDDDAYTGAELARWYPRGNLALFDITKTAPAPGEGAPTGALGPELAAGPAPAAPETGNRVRPSRRRTDADERWPR
jgi:hypothetical protein